MKVLLAIPGHLKTVPMGRFCAEALSELGHGVTIFDYRSRSLDRLRDRLAARSEEKAAVNARLRRCVERERPDVFITLFGFDISIESLAYLQRQRIPSVCWWINDPFQFSRSLKKARFYDFVFTNSAGCARDYRKEGVRHADFLPTACAPAVHRAMPPRTGYRCDVCFAGDWSPLRERLMEQLVGKFDLRVFGPWAKKVRPGSPLLDVLDDGFFTPDEMASMFSSARIVVNIHTWFGQFDHGVNPRLFEAAGCSACQIVDYKQEIGDLFLPSEVLTYRSLDEVPSLLHEILEDTGQVADIGRAAQQRAYRDHTYRERMATMLAAVGRAGA
jgi:spore maturation protein CgeB